MQEFAQLALHAANQSYAALVGTDGRTVQLSGASPSRKQPVASFADIAQRCFATPFAKNQQICMELQMLEIKGIPRPFGFGCSCSKMDMWWYQANPPGHAIAAAFDCLPERLKVARAEQTGRSMQTDAAALCANGNTSWWDHSRL